MSAQDLIRIANSLRGEVLEMVVGASGGHVAGPLSSADILTSLYLGGELRYDVNNPWWEERDRFVLSCGHYAPILYAVLAKAGFFPHKELGSFMQVGARLSGHPEYRCLPGVEATSGSLGQGVSFAVGLALAIKLKYGERPKAKTPRVYCMLSDGELQEGQVWEAFTTASRRQLDNLIFILDRNRVQIENYVSQVTGGNRITGQLESFGLHILEVQGHNIEAVSETFARARKVEGTAAMIVAHTIAGKGVTFMEGEPKWHDKVPNKEELKLALDQLYTKDSK